MRRKEQSDKQMPAARALKLLSWMIAIMGVCAGGIVIAQATFGNQSWVAAITFVLLSFAIAVVLRMFGAMGQMLFEFKGLFVEYIVPMKHDLSIVKHLSNEVMSSSSKLDKMHAMMEKMFDIGQKRTLATDSLVQSQAQAICDLKDINQGIHEIKQFFEQISERLEMHG